MVKPNLFIEAEAKSELKRIYSYIKKDFLQNAEKVRKEIIASLGELTNNPGQYPFDKYRKNNDGSYRAFEIHKYRITYHTTKERITVIRIRHSRDLFEY
ncbi:MAG: type II toxin-antitoxin system RelE/ParE family toxin [Bacteroidota bacterium]|nr:type II toxin-antitoxin system RelE/ParE family toxin [Bacteroidota bacterium]